ncbi:MAG: class I SAM-dependent methyltransferase [Desulfobacterales bacterium]|nr:class I SAM-dependent methyltransferase [Desulfobacterales bacterium]
MQPASQRDDKAPREKAVRWTYVPPGLGEFAIGVAGLRPGQKAAVIGADFMTGELLAAGVRVIAIDSSPGVPTGRKEKTGGAHARPSLRSENGRLPIASRSVDRVFANMVLHRTRDPIRALHEIKRTLKPGGRLVITELNKHDGRFSGDASNDPPWGGGCTDFRSWLAEAGFSNVIVGSVPVGPSGANWSDGRRRQAADILMATATA